MFVQIVADSYNEDTQTRFTSFIVRFPKVLLAELNTHRQLVRNAPSSRAITITRMIRKVETNPFIPTFTLTQKGMSGNENIEPDQVEEATKLWLAARDSAVSYVGMLEQQGIHKQNSNRLLDTFAYVDLILSGTDWDNFFTLRTAPEAQPEFRAIAIEMKRLYDQRNYKTLSPGDWHIPFGDKIPDDVPLETKIQIAVARCARISYETYDGQFSIDADVELFHRLKGSGHLSPFEHVAKAIPSADLGIFSYTYGYAIQLPEGLRDKLYLLDDDSKVLWTRQYSGFYTYRHHLEDGVSL
jgi:hypothetical protein